MRSFGPLLKTALWYALRRVEVFVGTSGWMYDWNPDGFAWYVENSGLNAVELNASFYYMPLPSQVAGWAKRGKSLRWAVKVHRRVTHIHALGEKAWNWWERFRDRFSIMDSIIDFYLFQMPPRFTMNEKNIEKIKHWAESTGLKHRFALELRHKSWFNEKTVKLASDLGITLVSIDAPIALWYVRSNDYVYLRMHGRTDWYAHDYSREELVSVAKEITRLGGKAVYVFFNNDHAMLSNAREMLGILEKLLYGS